MKSHSVAADPVLGIPYASFAANSGKLLSSIPDVVCVLNESGVFQFVSPSCTQLFGYSQKEMVGASFRRFIHPADIEGTIRIFTDGTQHCTTSNFENRYFRHDGSLAYIIWSAKWDLSDRLFYCVARDGAGKQLIEQRLLKAQRAAKAANYEFDIVNNCYTYTSDTIFEIFGLDRTMHPVFTAELFWQLIHPADVEMVKRHVEKPEYFLNPTLEYRIIRPDGTIVYINRIRDVVCGPDGKAIKNIGMLQDITDRKISELSLQQSEERFRSLVQNSTDMLGIVDAEGNYTFVGESVRERLGYSAEELFGKNAFDFIHPDEVAMVAASFQKIANTKTFTIDPFRFRNSKGEWRWLEVTVTNHLDNAAISGVVFNSRDVTDKKEKEDENKAFQQKIEDQNKMMVEVLEQMSDGFVTVTLDGRVIYWNAAAERISGIQRNTALGASIWALYPGIEQTPYYDIYKRLLVNLEPIQEVMFSPFHKWWVEIRAYRTEKGISVFFRDMTRQISAEEEMRKLSLIASETNNPVIVQDKNRKVQWVNKAFIALAGYSLEECVGKFIGDICDGPKTSFETLRYVQEKITNCEPFRIEVLNYKKNGETYWSDVSCQPILNDKREVVQYFSIATDITERKRLEKQLQREQKKRHTQIAAATLKAQEYERSVVSQELHDNVNQVLTTVKLYTEMCRDGFGDRDEMMNKSIRLLQDSINEIRSLSKRLSAPSLGKIKLAESVKELMEAVAATNKFEVCLDTTEIDHLNVEQDVHLAVYRILQEHITNILKHAEAKRIEVSFRWHIGRIYLKVNDDGKGFDTSKKSKGIGITNMITRAESLHGTFTIVSAPGKGCEITVSIPL